MIKEVIKARKKSAGFFSRQSADTTTDDFEQSNHTHQHFIGVLESVLRILGRCGTSGKFQVDKANVEDPLSKVTNIFEFLEIEADTEHTMTEPTSKPGPRPEVIFDEERSADETLWLVYCFFEDFNTARQYLKNLWGAYKDDGIDLTAVALATNTVCLHLVTNIEKLPSALFWV